MESGYALEHAAHKSTDKQCLIVSQSAAKKKDDLPSIHIKIYLQV